VGAVFAELAHFFLFQDPEGFSGKIWAIFEMLRNKT
jgi:hypothetical protein